MKQVYIKVYGWVNVLKQEGDYSLIQIGDSKICYNTLGHEFRTIHRLQNHIKQQRLF